MFDNFSYLLIYDFRENSKLLLPHYSSLIDSQGQNGGHTLQNPAQRVIDGVSYLSEAVFNASAEPSRYLTSWVADQIAPKYWELNAEIKVTILYKKFALESDRMIKNSNADSFQCCNVCKKDFTIDLTKHHCRACGKGVCKNCSTNNRPVPERGWTYPVRVCDNCFCDTGCSFYLYCATTNIIR